MTIRFRCAECRRKLKVPDEALGKKVQCPVCGARFIGRTEPSPPPVNESPPDHAHAEAAPVAAREPAAPAEASNEVPLIDTLFSEMASSSPLTPEESGIPREVELPPSSPFEPKPPVPPPLNLELDEPPAEVETAGVEPLEPEVVEDEVPVIEEAVAEEPAVLDAAEVSETVEEAEDGLDPVEVVDDAGEEEVHTPTVRTKKDEPVEADAEEAEVAEEAEPDEQEKKQPKKKKKRGLLCGCLAGVGLVMLLGCGGLGFVGYRFFSGSISDGDWKLFSSPEGRCSVMMPGEPEASVETPQPGTTLRKYSLVKPLARSEFAILFYDLPQGPIQPNALDLMMDVETRSLSAKLNATVTGKRSITLGSHQGREARLDLAGGARTGFVRFYLVSQGGQNRVYELIAAGPKMDTNSGTGAKFFNSFQIFNIPTGGPAGPGVPPQPIPPKR